MRKLVIERLEMVEEDGDFRRYSARLLRMGDEVESSEVLFYDLPGDLPLLEPDDGDPFLLGALMLAMREGRAVEVRGSVSRCLVENLEEWMGAWRCWKPELYQVVPIEVASWAAPERYGKRSPGSVAAFSGGVDASHLMWSWRPSGREREAPLRRAMFVHGFDIPLADSSYEIAYASAVETARSVGVPLDRVRTNFREVIGVNWGDACGIALASCMHFYKSVLTQGLIASSEPYHQLVIPWGSTPVTDYLLGSDVFRIFHHGAALGRSEKVKLLTEWPIGCANLRVCWQHAGQGANCGVCEKCVRTKLNFWAVGVEAPEGMGSELDVAAVKDIHLPSEVYFHEFRQILEYFRRGNPDDEIAKALESVLNAFRRRQRMDRFLSRLGISRRRRKRKKPR
ncbi:MAG: hypothetical protein QM627_02710 [Luteolibacter sp.]